MMVEEFPMPFEFRERYFNSTEAAIFYMQSPPNGAPVVLLHGVSSRWQPFRSILPVLAEKYQVYALDLRGHGRSSHTPAAYNLGDFTRDVYQFLIRQVQTPAVIYGHSLGGLVAINLAAQEPQMVRALILGDPPLYYHDTLTQDTFWHAAFIELLEFMTEHPDPEDQDTWLTQNMPNMSPERRRERVRSLEGLDPDVVRAVISDELMKGISLPASLAKVSCPVLLLRGNPTLGSALREQDVDFAVANIPELRVLEMETVGHGIVPANLLPQVMAFIDAGLKGCVS
jgi:pimeloyl-ACP methyl ester carboxylesterase